MRKKVSKAVKKAMKPRKRPHKRAPFKPLSEVAAPAAPAEEAPPPVQDPNPNSGT